MKSKNIVCEEWMGYKPNMPIQVVGVKNEKITSNGGGVEVFKNIEDAQKQYSDIDPNENSKRFTWVMRGEVNGKEAGRVETWQAYKMYSMEEQVLEKAVLETKFNGRNLPKSIEDVEMKHLILAIIALRDQVTNQIQQNTGSNSNVATKDIHKKIETINNKLKKSLNLKGKEAVLAFFKETNQSGINALVWPALRSIVNKYKLRSDRTNGKVFAEQETKLRELVRGYLKNKLNMNEAKKSKMIPMEKYGAAYMIDNGTLMSVAMNRDGSFETFDGDLDWGEVTAPENQKFLDDINKKFKTKFKLDDFAGR